MGAARVQSGDCVRFKLLAWRQRLMSEHEGEVFRSRAWMRAIPR